MRTEDDSGYEDDGEEPRPDTARVQFGLTGDRLDPSEVTRVTGLSPSRSWRKGDLYESKVGGIRPRHSGLWVIETEGTRVEQCALALLEVVEPHAEALRRLARAAGAEMSVGIWWDPDGGQGGFTVSSSVLRRLSDLGEQVDVYFPG